MADSQKMTPASANRTGSPRGGGRGQGTSGQPAAPAGRQQGAAGQTGAGQGRAVTRKVRGS